MEMLGVDASAPEACDLEAARGELVARGLRRNQVQIREAVDRT
jgi:hypothetical protein